MGRGLQSFKQKDLARALKAARSAGLEKPVVKIDRRSGNLYVWDDNFEVEKLQDDRAITVFDETWSK